MLVAYYYITMFGIYIFARCIRRCLSESFAALQPLTGEVGMWRFLELNKYLTNIYIYAYEAGPNIQKSFHPSQYRHVQDLMFLINSVKQDCCGNSHSCNLQIAFVNQNFINLM